MLYYIDYPVYVYITEIASLVDSHCSNCYMFSNTFLIVSLLYQSPNAVSPKCGIGLATSS